MKEIYAIVRPGKDRETKEALAKVGCATFTSLRVKGRGRQRGLRPGAGSGESVGMTFLPKKMLYTVVNDRQLKPAIHAILKVNQTSHYGDGKIFVIEAEEVRRIRTGETGEDAIL